MMAKDTTEITQTVPMAMNRRRKIYASIRHTYFLKKNVSGRDVAGVMPSGLLYCRAGTLPILLLTIRTPWAAGESPTVPMAHCSSTAMRQSSLPILVRSSCGTPNDFFHNSMSFFIGGVGSFPCVPFERNHCAHRGPMFVPPRGLAVVKG